MGSYADVRVTKPSIAVHAAGQGPPSTRAEPYTTFRAANWPCNHLSGCLASWAERFYAHTRRPLVISLVSAFALDLPAKAQTLGAVGAALGRAIGRRFSESPISALVFSIHANVATCDPPRGPARVLPVPLRPLGRGQRPCVRRAATVAAHRRGGVQTVGFIIYSHSEFDRANCCAAACGARMWRLCVGRAAVILQGSPT